MTNTWKFYRSNLIQYFPTDKFLQSELIGLGLGSSVLFKNTPSLDWNVYKTVSKTTELSWNVYVEASQTKTFSWKVYSYASSSIELEWDVYSGVSVTKEFSWIIPNTVDTNINSTKYYQSEQFLNDRDVFYKTQLYYKDPDKNQLSWKIGGSGLTLEWKLLPVVSNEIELNWKSGRIINSPTKVLTWSLGGKVESLLSIVWTIKGLLDMAFGLRAYKFQRYRIPNNLNYNKYRVISITNNGAAIIVGGSTIEIEINHAAMVAAGESDEYGDQLRLTYTNGENAEKELDLHVINPNKTNTKLRFRIQKGLPLSSTVSHYRLYSEVINNDFFEETFRDEKLAYYFYANSLSSNLDIVNGTFTSENTGIKRVNDTNVASLGFNVPDDSNVDVEFRFLDDGASNQSRYFSVEWRGDGSASRTFSVDNHNGVTNNQIANYNKGSGFVALGSPILNVKTIPVKLRINTVGNTVKFYLNDTLIDSVTDATPSTGGMRLVFSAGASVIVHSLVVSNNAENYTIGLSTPESNIVQVASSHKVLMKSGAVHNVQCTVIRLKRQPDGTFILENMQTIGEWGDSLPATLNQKDGSIELHLYNTNDRTLATVMELNT